MPPKENAAPASKVDMSRFLPKTYHVSLVLPATDDEKYHIDLFVKGCRKRERRAVVAISKAELTKMLPKEKQKELEIDMPPLALMLQKRIFDLLCENQAITEIAKKKKEFKEKHITNYCPGTLNPKPTSDLIKRGQEDQYKQYVEDSPLWGPDLYIALCEFYNLDIIKELQKLGIQISSIIKVQPENLTPDTLRVVSAIDPPPEPIQELQRVEEIWSYIRRNRFKVNEVEMIENVFSFYLDKPTFIIEMFDKTIIDSQSKVIYDMICYLLYDIGDVQRQYDNYIDKMKVYEVDEKEHDLYMGSYLDDFEDVPFDCDNVPLFLDLILDKVHCRQNEVTPEPSVKDETSIEEIFDILSPMREPSICPFYISDEVSAIRECIKSRIADLNQKYNICEADIYEYYENYVYEIIDPNSLIFDNEIEIKTLSLNRPKLTEVTVAVLKNWLEIVLREAMAKMESSDEEMGKYHADNLRSYAADINISNDSLQQIMYILLFNKMTIDSANRTCTSCGPSVICDEDCDNGNKSNLKSDPYKCKDIEHLIGAATLYSQQNTIKKYTYFEPMSIVALLQYVTKSLQELFEIEYEYFELTDSILLYFQTREKCIKIIDWEAIVRTPICMRDFCDFVWDEEQDWIDKEEKLYDKLTNNESPRTETDRVEKAKLDCEFNDFLILGSLKYQNVFGKTEVLPPGKGKGKAAPAKEISPKGKEKVEPKKTMEPESQVKEMVNVATSVEEVEKEYDFIGYNLGNLRVQVNGKDTSLIGTHSAVHVELVNWIYEDKILYIEINMDNHCLYYNNFLGPMFEKTPINFHLVLKNEIVLAFQRKNMSSFVANENDPANVPLPTDSLNPLLYPLQYEFKATWPNGMLIETVERMYDLHIIRQTKPTKYVSVLKPQPNSENVCTNTSNIDFKISSMECTELISNTDPPVLSVIQYKSEKKRIFLRNGSLISFNQDNSKLIYCLNGDLYMCSEPDIPEYGLGEEEEEEHAQGEEEIEPSPLVGDYIVLTSDGHQYLKTGNTVVDKGKVMLRTARDFRYDEIYVRRADGLNMLLTMDNLVTSFPDKTRITSYCYEEPDLIYISVSEYLHSNSEVDNTSFEEEEQTNMFICFENTGENESNEPWVSLKLKCIFEHPDYSTVSYIEPGCSETVIRPDTILKVNEKGLFNVYLGQVLLNVEINEVHFTNIKCSCASGSTLYFPTAPDVKMPRILLKTTDCSQIRKFYVDNKGKCCWNSDQENAKNNKMNMICCPKKRCEKLMIINKDMEGGRFLTQNEVDSFISSVNKKGYTFSELLDEDRNMERLQLIVPYDLTKDNGWKSEYQNPDVTPHLLQPKDLSLCQPFSEFWRGPFTVDRPKPLPPVKCLKLLPELVIIRHLCKVPLNYGKNILSIMNKYQKEYMENAKLKEDQLKETLIDKTEVRRTSFQSENTEEENTETEMTLEPMLEVKNQLDLLTEKSLLALKEDFLDDYLAPSPKESIHSIKPNPKLIAFMEKRAFEYRKEMIYKRALREYLVPPYFSYFPCLSGQADLGEVLIEVFEPQ